MMGNDRYTNPETSRLLAEAGLCAMGYHVWCSCYGTPRVERWCHQEETGSTLCARGNHVRALDLTDILHELTRPRPEEADARPLCEEYVLEYENGEHCCSGSTSPHAAVMGGTSAVEAAAACLIALLRERREK